MRRVVTGISLFTVFNTVGHEMSDIYRRFLMSGLLDGEYR
jgi:hypothetical protein